MLRTVATALCVLLVVLAVAAVASATTFVDLSAKTPGYPTTQADPMGVLPGGAVVMQSRTPGSTNVQYYYSATYSGGTSGTYTGITPVYSNAARVIAVNPNGQVALTISGTPLPGYTSYGIFANSFASLAAGDGSITQIPATTPGGYGITYATAIDNAGELGGGASMSNGYLSPYVFSGGAARDLPIPTGLAYPQYGGTVIAMSPNGAYAVGTFTYAQSGMDTGSPVAAFWTPNSGSWANGGSITDISKASWGGGLNYVVSTALAVNNSGQIVCGTGGGINEVTTPYIYQIGTGALTPLTGLRFSYPKTDTIPNNGAITQCLSPTGQVVGYEVVGGVNHAAIWQSGVLTDLNTVYGPSGLNILPTGFILNNATAVDSNGDIAGTGTDGSGNTIQAFVLIQPIPEPSTILLLASALAGLAVYAWRKRK